MCGIAGYVGTQQIAPERLAQCLTLMRRRGPDHAAWRHWQHASGRHAYLVHSRLNIIDLDARANQPFHVGTKWMIFNGELYNYLELKGELEAWGHRFTTQSDTEVLLRTIDQFGWDGLDQCEGMWALAVYDEQDGSLVLCRDRFGEKPLFLHQDATGLYFGSEPKDLFALLGRRLPVNSDHLYRYLVNGYKALYKDERTFFVGLRQLPRATTLRAEVAGRQTEQTYWQPTFTVHERLPYKEAVAVVRKQLIRTVELRLRADVPLAFCMSGGIDSLTLISIAKQVFQYDVHGFTFVNEDPRYNEQEMVEYAVQALGLRHTSVHADRRTFLDRLRALVSYHDAPVFTISYFAHWLVMEEIARQDYKISISGTGADELFTGYYDHHLAYLYEVRADEALHAAARQSWQEHVQPIVRNPLLGNPNAFIENPGLREHIFLDAKEFAGYLRRDWFEPFAEQRYSDGLLRNRMLNELFHENVPMILHEDDLNAMYFSVENRSPYLDRTLCELAYSIPTAHLIRDGYAKVVLRDAMRGIVPARVLDNHRKVGFNAPIFTFLDAKDPAVRNAVLDDSPIFEHVRRDKIEALINKPDLPNSESKFLFYFLSSKFFLEEQAPC